MKSSSVTNDKKHSSPSKLTHTSSSFGSIASMNTRNTTIIQLITKLFQILQPIRKLSFQLGSMNEHLPQLLMHSSSEVVN